MNQQSLLSIEHIGILSHCATLLIDMEETQLSKLQKMQNRVMRVILQCDRHIKVDHMLQFIR